MLTVEPSGGVLGATVPGLDLAEPFSERLLAEVLLALGKHGVLRFPDQHLDLLAQKRFSEQFGEIQGPSNHKIDPNNPYPEIDILSNLKENGRYIGAPDAGQDWHTDMTYREVPGFVNVLYGLRIPHRDGKPLGGTEFANMRLAYEGLPAELRSRLDGMTATHNIEKFWEHMRRVHNSPRPPMTDEQRSRRPPVVHPLFLTHPITGEKILYCNPGFVVRINELPERESDEMLDYLFAHQLQPQFRWTNVWAENDVLIWDHLGTLHRAIADYAPDEIRLIRRCQVRATKVFDPEYLRPVRELTAAAT
ncbi:MAG: TauD/TfdA family dioxygenase [Alphaproteobacteria bacterium]|nr:TauD/TfdA family dioxygenase [Alphaproteobacteria bacterium]